MPISITWGTKTINVPKSYLTQIVGTLYELDTEQFRLDLKALEDDPEGIPFPDTHVHNTEVTVAGVTYARFIEIVNGYKVEFEDGQYSVRLAGSNNNIFDVENGILAQNQVQVIPGNSAGLIVKTVGSGLSEEEHDALLGLPDLAEIEASTILAKQGDLIRVLGLVQENYYLDQTQYTDYQGQKLLTSGRLRLYSQAASVGSDNDVIARYAIVSNWNNDELQNYKVTKEWTLTTTTTTTSSTTTTTATTTTAPPEWRYADNYQIVNGSLNSGALFDTKSDNGVRLIFDEVTGAPGFRIEFGFAYLPIGITKLRIHINGFYDGNPAHNVKLLKYNTNTTNWDNVTGDTTDLPDETGDQDYQFDVLDLSDYVSNRQFKLAIEHVSNGSVGHTLNIDLLQLEDISTLTTTTTTTTTSSTTTTT
jgi:hypothetical protein